QPGHEGNNDSNKGDNDREPDRTAERALDVASANLGKEINEPVQGRAPHGKDQATAHVLKRQNIDAEHRPVERYDVQGENGRQHIKCPGTSARVWRRCAPASSRRRFNFISRKRGCGHLVNSLRRSTVLRITAANSDTMMVR